MTNYYNIIADLAAERKAQDARHGGPKHDDTLTRADWLKLFRDRTEKIATAAKNGDEEEYRRQLIKLAALSVAATEAFDRYYRC